MLENVSADECAYVRFGSKADMTACLHDVRFTPIADINRDIRGRNAGSNARGSTRKLGVMGIAFDYARPLFQFERELPEAMKPRRIEIQTGKAVGKDDKVRTIEHSKVA